MWIKWYPVEWLHSTCRDELEAAERATFQDYVCLASLPNLPPGQFKVSSLEALSRQLNTPTEVIEETNKKCIDKKRLEIHKNEEGYIYKILNFQVYQPHFVNKKMHLDKNRIDKNRKDKNIYTTFFPQFWEIYPSRNGKKLTKKETFAFLEKNLKEKDFSLLLQATQNYAKSKAVAEGYAKDAIRFLRKDYWREWLEPEKADTGRWSLD